MRVTINNEDFTSIGVSDYLESMIDQIKTEIMKHPGAHPKFRLYEEEIVFLRAAVIMLRAIPDKIEAPTVASDKIEVSTVFGTLFAQKSADPNYPGIYLCLKKEGQGGEHERQLALSEATPDHPQDGNTALRLLVWGSEDIEDYTNAFTFYSAAQKSD